MVAIPIQFLECFVAEFRLVEFRARQQVMEMFPIDTVALDGVGQGSQRRFLDRLARQGPVQQAAPLAEACQRSRRVGRVIGNVVTPAHEGIDRAHGRPFFRWHEQERIIKVFCRLPRDLPTLTVGFRHRHAHSG